MNKQEYVKKVETIELNDEERAFFLEEMGSKGISVNGDVNLFRFEDGFGGGKWDTPASAYFKLKGSGDSWSYPDGPDDPGEIPEGYTYTQFGSPAIGYAGVYKNVASINDIPDDVIDEWIDEAYEKAKEAYSLRVKARKEYGRNINSELRNLAIENGLNADKVVSAWWGMCWKKEVPPEEFIFEIMKISESEDGLKKLSIALSAHAGWVLENLNMKLRPSVPRTDDILGAIAKVLDVSPVTPEKYKKVLRNIRKGLPLPNQNDGSWMF